MNKKILIALIALPFILTACTFNPFSNGDNPTETSTTSTSENIQEGNDGSNLFSGSLQDLLATNQKLKCTYSYSDTETNLTSEGTIYLSDEKMRGDISSNMEGTTYQSHMIKTGDEVYVWQDGETQGMKMNFTELENQGYMEASEQDTATTTVDLTTSYDYDCSNWIPDNKMFEAPAEVTFSDLSDLINSVDIQNVPQGCDACNSLSGQGKEQCLQVLKC